MKCIVDKYKVMHLVKAVPAAMSFDITVCSKEYDCGVIIGSREKNYQGKNEEQKSKYHYAALNLWI